MRQVYYDPFGSRVSGYREGLEDETKMQANTRAARAADWEHYNLAPIELSRAQRNERIGAAGEPFAYRQYGLNEQALLNNVAMPQMQTARDLGAGTGNYAPFFRSMQGYLGGAENYLDSQRFGQALDQGTQQLLDGTIVPGTPLWGSTAQAFGIDPGELMRYVDRQSFVPTPEMAQGVDQATNWERIAGMARDNLLGKRDMYGRLIGEAGAQLGVDKEHNSDQWRALQEAILELKMLQGGMGGYQSLPSFAE